MRTASWYRYGTGFEPSAQIGEYRTVRNYPKNARLSLGNTLYIWGGAGRYTDANRREIRVMTTMTKIFFNGRAIPAIQLFANHLYDRKKY